MEFQAHDTFFQRHMPYYGNLILHQREIKSKEKKTARGVGEQRGINFTMGKRAQNNPPCP